MSTLEAMLLTALDARNLFCNPDLMEAHADDVDCGGISGGCEWCHAEDQTNVQSCRHSDNGEICPNDLAETLRAVAAVARDRGETP